MVAFELQHWNDDNGFRAYAEDCTNFLSQALHAGGWAYVGSGFFSTGNHSLWYYDGSFSGEHWTSDTWANAAWWNVFARNSGRVAALGNVWSTLLADVIQAKWAGGSSITHSMMVTAIDVNNNHFMTYHTNNTKNRSLQDIINANPGTTWYADRT